MTTLCKLLLAFAAIASGFVMQPAQRPGVAVSGFMDGLKKAFENDSTLAPPENAGLSGTKQMIDVTVCGKKTQAIPGQRMKDLVRAARAPVKFNCENGECGTCECLVNGRKVRVCCAKVPAKGPLEIKLK